MPQRRKISACIHCRQMKLRCDTQEHFPAACTRCAKSGLRCSIDPSFKRTAKRERVHELEKELQEMKATMMASPTTSAEQHPDSGVTPLQEQPLPEKLPEISNFLPDATFPTLYQGFVSQTIDEVEVTSYDIAELIQRYYTHYNPQFPILPELNSFVTSYDSCPLLFWTLVALAAKNSPNHSHLYLQLKQTVSRLATDVTNFATESVSVVQALLILCWWPFPSGATLTSPSWLYCGLAVHRALQSGLHRPHNYSDFYYQGSLDEQTSAVRQNTWLGCFIVSQSMSCRLGLPYTVHVDNNVLSAIKSRPPWFPPVLQQHLKIAYQSYQICQTLGNNELTTTGALPSPFPIIKMFDAELRAVQIEFGSNLSTFAEIDYLRVQLQLYSFLYTSKSNNRCDAPLDVANFLASAYLVALKLIQLARTNLAEVPYWSSLVQHSVEYAVLFLLKISRYPENKFVDLAVTRNSIADAWEILRSASEIENDHLSRISAIVEYLSTNKGDTSDGRQSVMVESRMAANIMFDAAWHAKNRFSSFVKEAKPLDYTSAAEAEKALQFELDLHFNPSFLGGVEFGLDFFFQDFGDHR